MHLDRKTKKARPISDSADYYQGLPVGNAKFLPARMEFQVAAVMTLEGLAAQHCKQTQVAAVAATHTVASSAGMAAETAAETAAGTVAGIAARTDTAAPAAGGLTAAAPTDDVVPANPVVETGKYFQSPAVAVSSLAVARAVAASSYSGLYYQYEVSCLAHAVPSLADV